MSVIPTVIQQHTEEAALHWLRRDLAVGESHYKLADLAKLDNRVDAHLDGLRIAGDDGWELCQQDLKWQESGEVFAAAVLALDSNDSTRINSVIEIGCSAPELERGLISALGWTPSPHVSALLAQLLTATNPAMRRVGIAGCAIRREDPAQQLSRLLNDADPRVRARALKAAAELGKQDLLPYVRKATTDKDDACRFWAAWSAARLSDRSESVKQTLLSFAVQAGPFQERAVQLAVRILDGAEANRWLGQLSQNAALLRAVAMGVGALGDPKHVGVLFQLMRIDATARVAGEAFSMITGVDLAYDDLDRDMPEDFQSGPTEDSADENVSMDADENLAWPNPDLVGKWWSANAQRFAAGRRYMCGREISEASLVKTLYDGYQRQRAAAALELGLLQPQRPLFEVRARGDWQRQLLPRWFPNAS